MTKTPGAHDPAREAASTATAGALVQPPTSQFAELGAAEAVGAAMQDGGSGDEGTTRPRVSNRYIWLVILAYLGGTIALVAPIGISLSLRVQELAPQNVEVLGYIIGAGAAVVVFSQPLIGMMSDRTRSRFGRRRPFILLGSLVGIIGLTLSANASTVWLLALAWMVTQVGWTSANGTLISSQADKLPEEQRGKVAGLSGFSQMIGAVIGVGLASAFIGSNFLVFLVPGFVGLLFMLLFVLFIKEPDSRHLVTGDKLTVGKIASNMVFNPRQYPDFAWNWLGRLFFNFGVTFATTFTTLFYASRLSDSGQVADIGGLIALLSLVGVFFTAGGALVGGMLSDRLKKRRVFVLMSSIAFTFGAIAMAFGGDNLGILVSGSILTSVGLGVFSAVDQAIVLDVLPEVETNAGRFLGINNYSTALAQSIAPIAAAPLLLIGMTGAEKNYGLLFIIAAVCTLVGGTLVMLKVRGSR